MPMFKLSHLCHGALIYLSTEKENPSEGLLLQLVGFPHKWCPPPHPRVLVSDLLPVLAIVDWVDYGYFHDRHQQHSDHSFRGDWT